MKPVIDSDDATHRDGAQTVDIRPVRAPVHGTTAAAPSQRSQKNQAIVTSRRRTSRIAFRYRDARIRAYSAARLWHYGHATRVPRANEKAATLLERAAFEATHRV